MGTVSYFSALGPLWDVQVALLFSNLCPKHLPLIISCNDPQGPCASRWCGLCSKCAFVAAVLGAFFPVAQVRAIFGDDPFEGGALVGHLDLLAGLGPEAAADDRHTVAVVAALPAPARADCKVLTEPWKPLECVGGPDETRLALRLVEERYRRERRRLPSFFTAARRAALLRPESGGSGVAGALDLTLLEDWGEEHLLPTWLEGTVRACLAEAVGALKSDLSQAE